MKKVEDITDVTGGHGDISNIADVIDDVINDVNPIQIINDGNFVDTTGISESDSPTNDQSGDGWIVTSAECENRDKCDKVKQTIVGSIDEINEVTNNTIQFGTIQTSDRKWFTYHLRLKAYDL